MKAVFLALASLTAAAGAAAPRAKVLVQKEFDASETKHYLVQGGKISVNYFVLNQGSIPAFGVKVAEDFAPEQWTVTNGNGGAVLEEGEGLIRLSREFAELAPGANETFSISLTPLLAGPLKSTGALVTYKYENQTKIAEDANSEDLDGAKVEDEESRFITATSRSSSPGNLEILTVSAHAKETVNVELWHSVASWVSFGLIALAAFNYKSASAGTAAPSKKRA